MTALSFKYCYLTFEDFILLTKGLLCNRTIVKLDLSNNALKSCVAKFLLDALVENYCLAEIDVSGNFLDNEFAVDLSHLLEDNNVLHTVDISKNPIGPEGTKYLLKCLLQNNDTLESLGNLDYNQYMGIRLKEEIK